MKNINKTYYWIGLIVFFSLILGLRYFGFLIELRKEFFYAIFGLWICLILLPLFGEIEFLGIKLKKEIDELKKDVKSEIQSIKYEINTSNKQQVFLGYGPLPSDNKIPELEKEINDLKEKYHLKVENGEEINFGFKMNGIVGRFDVPDNTIKLFQVRYKLEELLTRIWNYYHDCIDTQNERNISPARMLNDLKNIDLVDNNIIGLTREILSICNAAIHGRKVSDKQIDFVLKNGKIIHDTLYDLTENE